MCSLSLCLLLSLSVVPTAEKLQICVTKDTRDMYDGSAITLSTTFSCFHFLPLNRGKTILNNKIYSLFQIKAAANNRETWLYVKMLKLHPNTPAVNQFPSAPRLHSRKTMLDCLEIPQYPPEDILFRCTTEMISCLSMSLKNN